MKNHAVLFPACVWIFFVFITAAATQTDQPPVSGPAGTTKVSLKAGTELKLRFAQRVDSKTAVIGDLVELVLDEDLIADNRLVAGKGLRAIAKVTEGKKAEKKRRAAKELVIQLDYLLLGGTQVPITGDIREKAKADTGTVVASGIVFGVAGILAALSGGHATIREGTVISAWIVNDVEVQPLETENRRPAPAAPPP